MLVVSPQGRTMLIDGGGSIGPVRSEFDFGEDVVAPYLWSRGLDNLDVVALTHAQRMTIRRIAPHYRRLPSHQNYGLALT